MKRNFKTQSAIIIFFGGILLLIYSCKKQDAWLNAKQLQGDVVPRTLADYQAVLDWNPAMNDRESISGLLGTDNLYMKDADYAATDQQTASLYSWQNTIWANGTSSDWSDLYASMEYANVVLDGIAGMNAQQAGYSNLKGEALFYRGFALYNLAQVFCKPYSAASANTDMGVPVRLSSDANILYPRGTLQQTYLQMISDVTASANLLDKQPLTIYRPSTNAANALLAKIYLVMGDYSNAGTYANKVLLNGTSLLDFNNTTLASLNNYYRFPPNGINNPEIIFYASCSDYAAISASPRTRGSVDTNLYNSYNDNDLRKSLFYVSLNGTERFRGDYAASGGVFCGIATNEVYLIRAECNARQGNTSPAMADLNKLLKNRYATGTFTNLTAADATTALQLVLQERRKELPFTANIRWEDLRRLNTDPTFRVTVTRIINGTVYTLPPNDPKYVLPIPDNEIQLSGIQQNPR